MSGELERESSLLAGFFFMRNDIKRGFIIYIQLVFREKLSANGIPFPPKVFPIQVPSTLFGKTFGGNGIPFAESFSVKTGCSNLSLRYISSRILFET